MQPCGRHRTADRDQIPVAQISEQDPNHAEGQVELGGNIGNRDRNAAHLQDRKVLGIERPWVTRCSP